MLIMSLILSDFYVECPILTKKGHIIKISKKVTL